MNRLTMLPQKNILVECPFISVSKDTTILPQFLLTSASLLLSLLLVDQLGHSQIESFLLLLLQYSTHLVSSILVEINPPKIQPVL